MMHDARCAHCALRRQVNQCEMSVKTRDEATIAYCQQKGIVYEVCVCVCGCVCVCLCLYLCLCVCVCVSVCVRLCTDVCAYMRACACVQWCAFRQSDAELALRPALGTLSNICRMFHAHTHARTHACMHASVSIATIPRQSRSVLPSGIPHADRAQPSVCIAASLQRPIAHRRSSP
jgi:hypothetical protein